jgi:malate dehydrogenase (quinone)
MPRGQVDVLIVGGGVCGTALLFELARYTDLSRILLVERYDQLARVNSRATNNSQTIHCGDIETNYTLEKAVAVKRTAEMIVHYAGLLPEEQRQRCVFRTPKMVLAVGERECTVLRERFARFSPHFPAMELLEKEQIAAWEPNVALVDGEPRPEELVAIGIRSTYTAVDYEELAQSFVDQARAAIDASTDRHLDLLMGTTVQKITPEGELFRVSLVPTAGSAAASP